MLKRLTVLATSVGLFFAALPIGNASAAAVRISPVRVSTFVSFMTGHVISVCAEAESLDGSAVVTGVTLSVAGYAEDVVANGTSVQQQVTPIVGPFGTVALDTRAEVCTPLYSFAQYGEGGDPTIRTATVVVQAQGFASNVVGTGTGTCAGAISVTDITGYRTAIQCQNVPPVL
jgi:hypothetical protein